MTGGLQRLSWVYLVIHVTWTCVLGLEMYKFWTMRTTMRIFARAPGLALVSAFACIVVQTILVVQAIMSQEGLALSCVLILYSHAITLGLAGLPYLLRGVRAVIVSHTVWRRKYMQFLARKYISMYVVSGFIGQLGVCFILHQFSANTHRPDERCLVWADWKVWGVLVAALISMTCKLFVELARLNDKINMATEIFTIASVWISLAILHWTVLILDAYGVIYAPEQLNFNLWACMTLMQVITIMIEPRRGQGGVCCWKKKAQVAVAVDDARTTSWRTAWRSSKNIMQHPMLTKAFEKHAQDYMCSELYDFIKEAEAYGVHARNASAEDLFVVFRRIIDKFISPGSELEINIGTAMRNDILKIGCEENFTGASSETRRDVFGPATVEVTKVLDDNLVHSFLTKQLFIDSCQRWEEQRTAHASVPFATMDARLSNVAFKMRGGTADIAALMQAMSSFEEESIIRRDDAL